MPEGMLYKGSENKRVTSKAKYKRAIRALHVCHCLATVFHPRALCSWPPCDVRLCSCVCAPVCAPVCTHVCSAHAKTPVLVCKKPIAGTVAVLVYLCLQEREEQHREEQHLRGSCAGGLGAVTWRGHSLHLPYWPSRTGCYFYSHRAINGEGSHLGSTWWAAGPGRPAAGPRAHERLYEAGQLSQPILCPAKSSARSLQVIPSQTQPARGGARELAVGPACARDK